LADEEGCRVAHKEGTGFPRQSGKRRPCRDGAVVRSLDAWRALETVGPARNVVESLTPKPGIREQHRPN
jgi:hypothetical protein